MWITLWGGVGVQWHIGSETQSGQGGEGSVKCLQSRGGVSFTSVEFGIFSGLAQELWVTREKGLPVLQNQGPAFQIIQPMGATP